MSDFFQQLKSGLHLRTASKEFDPADHVIDVFTEFDRFRKAIVKREVKSRSAVINALEDCVTLLQHNLLQLPANVEHDLKQFILRVSTMKTMIARKDGVYKLTDLIDDLTDTSKGKLNFIEQRVKNNARMFREGTGMPPITDGDRAKMQKHYAKESKLPERIATPFTVIDSGVVPLFEDFNLLSDKILKLVGFNYERIADSFVVLKGQKLLAADIPKLTEMFGEGRKAKLDIVKLMADILSKINESSSIKYEMMSTSLVSNPKNANIKFAWLIPADKLRTMTRLARTTRLQSWSLPHRHQSVL